MAIIREAPSRGSSLPVSAFNVTVFVLYNNQVMLYRGMSQWNKARLQLVIALLTHAWPSLLSYPSGSAQRKTTLNISRR